MLYRRACLNDQSLIWGYDANGGDIHSALPDWESHMEAETNMLDDRRLSQVLTLYSSHQSVLHEGFDRAHSTDLVM